MGPRKQGSAPLTRKSDLQTGRRLVTPETAPPHVALGTGNSSRPADVTGAAPARPGLRAETGRSGASGASPGTRLTGSRLTTAFTKYLIHDWETFFVITININLIY